MRLSTMLLEDTTPLLLTLNEEANLTRTLAALDWARRIVVVDSGSTDATLALMQQHSAVDVFSRKFDTHAGQWSFGLHETGIETAWVLTLDADYVLTAGLIEEMRQLQPEPEIAGYQVRFTYCALGRPLRGSLYPPRVVLFRRSRADFYEDGHTQALELEGTVRRLKGRILHDDRKPLTSWLQAQDRYMRLEARKLALAPLAGLTWPDRLRKLLVVAPFAVLVYCLFIKGAILDGRPGWHYALQRMISEAILSVRMIRERFKPTTSDDGRTVAL